MVGPDADTRSSSRIERPRVVSRGSVPSALLAGLGTAWVLHALVPTVGTLTWSVAVGVVAGNAGILPRRTRPELARWTRLLLRVGVALLGFSVSFGAMASLGAPVVLLVVGTLVATMATTLWFGSRLEVGAARSLLVAAGVAICGASAIAAVKENAEADEDDVAAAIALITLFGSVAMIAFPLLRSPLGLSSAEFATWVGVSVHEVGQVVAAASPAGQAAVALAVVVKLTRVVLLAPVVAVVGLRVRRASESSVHLRRPPLVPAFVLAFLGCVCVRSTGVVPHGILEVIATAQVVLLAAALFGMGAAVDLPALVRGSGRVLLLGALATVVVSVVGLIGVIVVA